MPFPWARDKHRKHANVKKQQEKLHGNAFWVVNFQLSLWRHWTFEMHMFHKELTSVDFIAHSNSNFLLHLSVFAELDRFAFEFNFRERSRNHKHKRGIVRLVTLTPFASKRSIEFECKRGVSISKWILSTIQLNVAIWNSRSLHNFYATLNDGRWERENNSIDKMVSNLAHFGCLLNGNLRNSKRDTVIQSHGGKTFPILDSVIVLKCFIDLNQMIKSLAKMRILFMNI